MTHNKIQGKFYPLQHQEFLHLNRILTQSEFSLYLWLKTNDPFGGKLIEADTHKIAKDLGISRRTVQRALVKLREHNFIDLVINKFKYQMKSKSVFGNDDSSNIEDKSEVATPMSSDDTEIVSATPGSSRRHPCRLNDTKIAQTTPLSPSSSETQSGTEFKNPKINKTYIDFIQTLSESERESFLKFVKEKIRNLSQPVNDVEAWLASQTKINQNRWEVYYQKYQEEKKGSSIKSNSSSINSEAKQRAIARFQEHILQQKSGQKETKRKLKKEVDELLDNPNSTIKSIERLENQSKPIQKSKPLSKRIAEGCEQLRNLRMRKYFADEAVAGGMV